MPYQMANVLRGLGPPDQMTDVENANLNTAQKQMSDNLARSQLQAQMGMHDQDINLGQQSLANQRTIQGDYVDRNAAAVQAQQTQGQQELANIGAQGDIATRNVNLEMAPAVAANNRAQGEYDAIQGPKNQIMVGIMRQFQAEMNGTGSPYAPASGGASPSAPSAPAGGPSSAAALPSGSSRLDYSGTPSALNGAYAPPAGGGTAPGGAGTPSVPGAPGGGGAQPSGSGSPFKDPGFLRSIGYSMFGAQDPDAMTRQLLMSQVNTALQQGNTPLAQSLLSSMGGLAGQVHLPTMPGLTPAMQQASDATLAAIQPDVKTMTQRLAGATWITGNDQQGLLAQAQAVKQRLDSAQLLPQAKQQIIANIRSQLISSAGQSGHLWANAPGAKDTVQQILAMFGTDPMGGDTSRAHDIQGMLYPVESTLSDMARGQ